MIEFDVEEQKKTESVVSIKVVGVGGAGGNTINSMSDALFENIELIAANTDAQALKLSKAHKAIQLGIKATKGLGTGANPELGKRAVQEDLEKMMDLLIDADIVFLTGGLGGGTGSGGLPVLAQALREKGILSIAVVTKPFAFEGKRRSMVAQESVELLKKEVDTLIVIPNQKLLEIADKKVSMIDAFSMINDVLIGAVKGIADIISCPGHINVDFADVRTIMKDTGLALMGTGRATGEDRATQAALQAISSPLLENMDIAGASGVLLNISGGTNLALHEISAAASVIYDKACENANIILGSVIDSSMSDEIMITVIATGFEQKIKQRDNFSITPDPVKIKASTRDLYNPKIYSEAQQESSTSSTETAPEKPEINQDNTYPFATDILDVPTFLRKEQDEGK